MVLCNTTLLDAILNSFCLKTNFCGPKRLTANHFHVYKRHGYSTLANYQPHGDASFKTGRPAGLEIWARLVLERIPGSGLPGFCRLGSYDSPYYFA